MNRVAKIYLAGPEVFLPNASEILEKKSNIAREIGFTPIAIDATEIPACDTKFQHGVAITVLAEKLMLNADAIVANLTPFRGISADPGTCFELAFMCALGRQVCAYTNDQRNYLQRVTADPNNRISSDTSGEVRTKSDGMLVEDFDMIDNLILHGSVETRGGLMEVNQASEGEMFTDMTAYQKVLELLAVKLL